MTADPLLLTKMPKGGNVARYGAPLQRVEGMRRLVREAGAPIPAGLSHP